ncbi:hypothetical protein ARMGADRAFT_185986 [Armillaria gallica]|uniref:Uncharacterized protein n=1 Tax=Armillaria gallica TaxID=47427 RepID=A0A2H3D913_ARMGA|nr:hypothetical protein ARMGADRAFT_185986 [Armillaria gallica]
MRPSPSLLTLPTTCISPRRHSILSWPIILSLPSLYHYSYLSHFYAVYPFLLVLFRLLFLFPQTFHSLYLANLHISPSRLAYHYQLYISLGSLDFLLVSVLGVLGNIIFPFVKKVC